MRRSTGHGGGRVVRDHTDFTRRDRVATPSASGARVRAACRSTVPRIFDITVLPPLAQWRQFLLRRPTRRGPISLTIPSPAANIGGDTVIIFAGTIERWSHADHWRPATGGAPACWLAGRAGRDCRAGSAPPGRCGEPRRCGSGTTSATFRRGVGKNGGSTLKPSAAPVANHSSIMSTTSFTEPIDMPAPAGVR
jgi:hypothetical protein